MYLFINTFLLRLLRPRTLYFPSVWFARNLFMKHSVCCYCRCACSSWITRGEPWSIYLPPSLTHSLPTIHPDPTRLSWRRLQSAGCLVRGALLFPYDSTRQSRDSPSWRSSWDPTLFVFDDSAGSYRHLSVLALAPAALRLTLRLSFSVGIRPSLSGWIRNPYE